LHRVWESVLWWPHRKLSARHARWGDWCIDIRRV